MALLFLVNGARAQTHLTTLASDGAWTWYNDPRALFHNGALYFGYVRSDGSSVLNALDLQTGISRNLWTSTWKQFDDHDNAGLLRLLDGRLLAIYARHGSANTFSYRHSLSPAPATPDLWSAEQTSAPTGAGVTYSNPYQLAEEAGKVYNFCRDLNFNPTVLTSTDRGATWSPPRHFIKTGTGSIRPYVKYCSDYFNRIDFLYTDGHPRDVNNSLYHLYYQGDAIYKTDGTLLKNFSDIPLLHDLGERGSVIYQYSNAPSADPNDFIQAGRAWCWEIVYQTNGWPACGFTVQRDGVAGADWTGDRIYYYYARWTGTNWQKRFIAQAGRPLYSSEDDYAGGIALDPEDPATVYISTDAANPFDLTSITNVPLAAHYEIFKGVTTNGGLSFTWTPVTTNSTVDNLRPYVPRNRRGVPALIWFRGNYPTFVSFNTSVVGLFTNEFPMAGLAAYWPLDSASGGTTPDRVLGNHLKLFGNPQLSGGVISNAFSFDGNSQYLSLAHSPGGTTGLPLYQPGAACTVTLWVRGAPQTNRYLFTESSTTNNTPLFLLQTGINPAFQDRLDLLIRSSSGTQVNHFISTQPVFDGTWHHLAFVDDAGAVQLYLDGNPDTNFVYVPSGSPAFNVTSLGALVRSNATGFFHGDLDEVTLWKRALSAGEVRLLMSNSIPRSPPPPLVPPVIGLQSSGSTNALGESATLSAQVFADFPSYQWFKNGLPLPDKTNVFLVSSATTSGSNSFTMVVTNAGGSVTSAPMPLLVLPDPGPDVSLGLISYWPLDEATNGSGSFTSPDLYSRNDLQLIGMNAGNVVPGRFGNALVFDGISQYATRMSGLPANTFSNFTVSFWVKGLPGQVNKQVFAEANAAGDYFSLGTENSTPAGGALNLRASPGLTDRKSSRVVFDNTWHQVTWTDESGKGRLYVDGVPEEADFTHIRGSRLLETTTLGALVQSGPANFFAGTIDEVAVWNRRLTYTEIQQLQTHQLPASPPPLPPAIITQPADATDGVFPGDTVSFLVQAIGTAPLTYQWQKNKQPIPPVENPTATNANLVLMDVQSADAGNYSVVITNAAGAVTSSVVALSVVLFLPVTNGVALQLDVDLMGAPNIQPGFEAMSLCNNGASFSNAVQVTLFPVGNINLADRQRSAAPLVVDNPPALTQARIYNDFAFASSTSDGNGMRILISRLAPNTQYGLTVWSFDPQSPGTRISDWTDITAGTAVPIASGYSFNGSIPPVNDFDDTFGALLTSSAGGQVEIQGLRHGGTSYGVFFNGLQLIANPGLRIITAKVNANGNIQLSVQTQYAGQSIALEERADLQAGSWRAATNIVSIQQRGLMVAAELARTADRLFYRVRSP